MSDAPAPEGLADEFWAFSLALYAHPQVAAACLRLQDAHGLDVNLLLLCCFLARGGRGRLSAAALAAAEARAAPWRARVLAPLREARRALKTMISPGAPALHAEVARIELAAEREAQRLLFASWSPPSMPSSDRAADERANLALYFSAKGLAAEVGTELIGALQSVT
jgi:uncharacterized protein (TIGR02444 family)